jgi:hypothetical protein
MAINPGLDASGNGNNWSVNNINYTTVGLTYDVMTDVPTLTSATAANYCVMNPLALTSTTLTNGNLTATKTATANINLVGTMAVQTGKYYWECAMTALAGTSNINIGVARAIVSNQTWALTNIVIWGDTSPNSAFRYGTNLGATSTNIVQGDLVGIALDMDNGTVALYINNTLINTITGLDTTTPHVPFWNSYGSSDVGNLNFGQRPFAYTPPTGFVALNTFNLPTPTIGATASTQANKYMDVSLYTGNGSTQSVTNSGGFQPDFVWIKSRSDTWGHALYDVIRGVDKRLTTNSTSAEATTATGLTSFNSNGFSLSTNGDVNNSADTYVAWQWDAGGTGVSNTAGSITSTVSANTSAGFSVVTYTGTRTSAGNDTIGHGLGVAPSMIISKSRSNATAWIAQHTSLGQDDFFEFNRTDAVQDSVSVGAGSLPKPTSTVFYGSWLNGLNVSGQTFVAYCFSEVAGYSKFGSYTGNGSSNGPFVYLGFRPRYVMIKSSTDVTFWYVYDSARNTYNLTTQILYPNSSNAEATGVNSILDFVSNGFKIRDSGAGEINLNGATFIYACFAENPFKYSLAR